MEVAELKEKEKDRIHTSMVMWTVFIVILGTWSLLGILFLRMCRPTQSRKLLVDYHSWQAALGKCMNVAQDSVVLRALGNGKGHN